jgi:hypothetical protein
MNGQAVISSAESSTGGKKQGKKTKKYFNLYEDNIIITEYRNKTSFGMGSINSTTIAQDLALRIDRDADSIKERYKKLNALSSEDILEIQQSAQVIMELRRC